MQRGGSNLATCLVQPSPSGPKMRGWKGERKGPGAKECWQPPAVRTGRKYPGRTTLLVLAFKYGNIDFRLWFLYL